MDSKETVRSYIGRPKWKRLIGRVMVFVCIACIILAVKAGKTPPPEPTRLEPEQTKSGVRVYVDVVGVSGWVVEETKTDSSGKVSSSRRFYVVMDEDENLFLAMIPSSDYSKLKEQKSYYETGREKPEPVRLSGETRGIDSELRKHAVGALETDEATFDELFGSHYLLVGAYYNSPVLILAVLGAVGSAFAALFLGLLGLRKSSTEKWSLRSLERKGLLDAASADLAVAGVEPELNDRLRLGRRFVFGREIGLAAPWDEVLWSYRRKQTIELFTTRYFMIGTADGRLHSIRYKKREDERVLELMELFRSRNPEILLGYSLQNQREYKARYQERIGRG